MQYTGLISPPTFAQNVDFSAEAVRLGQEVESKKKANEARMQWVRADLRSWNDVSSSLSQFAPFDVILDKSTSDAIATSEPRTFSSSSDEASDICPTVRRVLDQKRQGEMVLHPVELLALHLVPLTRQGTTWFALSYSASRFDSLTYIGENWTLLSRTPLKAPPGKVSSSVAKTPEVFHWIYVLRRK
jgi:hypothetical protein